MEHRNTLKLEIWVADEYFFSFIQILKKWSPHPHFGQIPPIT